jgi:hypothetical protein
MQRRKGQMPSSCNSVMSCTLITYISNHCSEFRGLSVERGLNLKCSYRLSGFKVNNQQSPAYRSCESVEDGGGAASIGSRCSDHGSRTVSPTIHNKYWLGWCTWLHRAAVTHGIHCIPQTGCIHQAICSRYKYTGNGKFII